MTPDAKWVGRVTFQHASGDPDSRVAPVFTASIDAALALVERVLPGAKRSVTELVQGWSASVLIIDAEHSASVAEDYHAEAPTAPLALLTALLLALTSNQEGNDEAVR